VPTQFSFALIRRDWSKIVSTIQRFNDFTISIDLTPFFLAISDMKRLLVEIVMIAAVIAFGWNTPFNVWTSQAYTNITNWFDSLAR